MPNRMIATKDSICAVCGMVARKGDTVVVERRKNVTSIKHADCTTWISKAGQPHRRKGKSTSVVTWSANIK